MKNSYSKISSAGRACLHYLSRFMRPAAPPLSRRIVVAKKNPATWPFEEFVRWVQNNGYESMPSEFPLIESRLGDLRERLISENRETSYRHELRMMNAWDVCNRVSSTSAGRVMLHWLAEHHCRGWAVELGSAFGIASMAITLALRQSPETSFDGIEFEDWRAQIAAEGVRRIMGERADVHAGRIEDVLPKLATRGKRIAWAFVDAKHTYEDTMEYHRLITHQLSDGAIVVYDDINWSSEMSRFWKELVAYKQVTDALSVGGRWGIVRYASSW
ncbi:MAG: class I SAM-dependent methyltransferase [Gammaproteobacteria bacterium]|nr:class I SAM-dependent methyltransferase [Gammaproteobacteria bacterium]